MSVRFALLMALVATAMASRRELTQAAEQVRYCVPVEADQAFLQSCTSAISQANTPTLEFTCVAGGDAEACIQAISSGQADITTLGAATMPIARDAGVLPIAAEFYGEDDGALTEYYSVAIVPAAFCENNPSLNDLAGLRACNTGFRRTAGWNVPVGRLVDAGVIPIVDEDPSVTQDAESVASFFSEVCAPGTSSDGPTTGGEPYQPLCTACAGDCSSEDPYADYPGTLRGVMEGACDVAFTKQDVLPTYASDGTEPAEWATAPQSEFRLLCPQGGCATADQYARCNLGRVPAKAVLAAENNPNSDAIADALVAAANGPTFLEATTEIEGTGNVIFSQGTEALLRVDIPFDQFFDPATLGAFVRVRELEASPTATAAQG